MQCVRFNVRNKWVEGWMNEVLNKFSKSMADYFFVDSVFKCVQRYFHHSCISPQGTVVHLPVLGKDSVMLSSWY